MLVRAEEVTMTIAQDKYPDVIDMNYIGVCIVDEEKILGILEINHNCSCCVDRHYIDISAEKDNTYKLDNGREVGGLW